MPSSTPPKNSTDSPSSVAETPSKPAAASTPTDDTTTSNIVIAERWKEDQGPNAAEFHEIVTKCLEHRPWFNDKMWEADERTRRDVVITHITGAIKSGEVWYVLRNGEYVGIFITEAIQPGVDCRAHFIFFDRRLRDKIDTCNQLIERLFDPEGYDLGAIRVEVPTYASKLAAWLRDKLGFKYEAEWLGCSAEHGWRYSRKVRTIKHRGTWHDSLLLSLQREEPEHGRRHRKG